MPLMITIILIDSLYVQTKEVIFGSTVRDVIDLKNKEPISGWRVPGQRLISRGGNRKGDTSGAVWVTVPYEEALLIKINKKEATLDTELHKGDIVFTMPLFMWID